MPVPPAVSTPLLRIGRRFMTCWPTADHFHLATLVTIPG
jgi:hypothetical protein